MPVLINGSSGLTTNDGSVFTNTSGNVGIGTSSPAVKLDVVGNSAAVQASEVGGASVRMAAGGATGFFGTYSNHPLTFLTSSSERMRIDSAGNVGIGVPSVSPTPTVDYVTMEIGRTGNSISGATFKGTMYINSNAAITAGSTAFSYRNNGVAGWLQLEGDSFNYKVAASGTAGNNISWIDRWSIQTNGAQTSVIPGGSTLLPDFACRAFVNFLGTGTVAIRASGNVSSITDNGVGDYTVNLTTAMPDANYAAVAVGTEAQTRVNESSGTTTSFRIRCLNLSNGGSDSFTVSAAILR